MKKAVRKPPPKARTIAKVKPEKSAPTKRTARQPAAKTSSAEKTSAKNPSTRKPVSKQPVSKRPASKQPSAKKESARKPASERPSAKEPPVAVTSGGKATSASGAVSNAEVTIDRRDAGGRCKESNCRQKGVPVPVERRKLQRRAKVNRRRQIDPTTCERDYTHDEVEFMSALDRYKRSSGRMFPTCSEILEVVRNLGYEKRVPEPVILASAEESSAGSPQAISASPVSASPPSISASASPPSISASAAPTTV